MDWLLDLLSPGNESLSTSILLYSFVIFAGIYLGKIKIFGVSLGVTFVLFVGILMGHFGYVVNTDTLHFLREFGLILFIFSIGMQVGPGFFSSFKEELIARIEKDDKIWFPYCMSLSKKLGKEPARTIDGLQITSEQRTEDTIEALLADLKSIMVKHLSGDYDENLCYAVLFSVCSLEKDIKQHNRIRYRILTPMVSAMEKLCI